MGKKIDVSQYTIVKFSEKWLLILNSIDNQITTNLHEGNVKTRPVKSNGVGCCMLLPVILILYTCFDDVSLLYQITTCMSVGLLFYSLLFALFLSTSCIVLKETIFGGCLASALISALLIFVFLKQGFTFSISVSLLSVLVFSSLLRVALDKCQRTFTIGEAMIVTQAISLFSVMSVIKIFFGMKNSDEEMELISTIVYAVLSAAASAVAVLYALPPGRRTAAALGVVVSAAAALLLLLLHLTLGQHCLMRIIRYMFLERDRWRIITFWLILVVVAVGALALTTLLAVKADTVLRKIFHVLASLVFLSGILADVQLMSLAAGIGLGAIIFVEALRKSAIEPVAGALQAAFAAYSDEKDCGAFAMTPLYLYSGLACPLLLVPHRAPLELLSGVLATGVGDTAASWFGSRFGLYKWPDSSRTFEGSAANVLSQVAAVCALLHLELLTDEHAMLRTAVAATASALVEATTDQVDNLVLPLVTLVAHQLTGRACYGLRGDAAD